jgi:LPXTG-motif cell wall-anchored protein
MRTRLRLGAAGAVGLGALLLATVLASPALAWHSNVTVNARCLDGQVRVHYTVAAWEKGHEATVDVSYELNGAVVELESDDHFFGPQHNQFSGHFDLPAGTTGTITFTAVAHWKDDQKPSTDVGSDDLPAADKCEKSTTTTEAPTTTAPPTTQAPSTTLAPTTTESSVAPSTSLETTTTAVAVGPATSTTAGGQLPFTGASSGSMLLAGIALVGGGAVVLLVGRIRDRHATR